MDASLRKKKAAGSLPSYPTFLQEIEKTLSSMDTFNAKMSGIFLHMDGLLSKVAGGKRAHATRRILNSAEFRELKTRLEGVQLMRRVFEKYRELQEYRHSLVVFGQSYMNKVNGLFEASDKFHAMRKRIVSEFKRKHKRHGRE